MPILDTKNNNKKSTFILVYINKITKKNFYAIASFLKQHQLVIHRIEKSNRSFFAKDYTLNVNYLIETKAEFSVEQIQSITKSLNQFTKVIAVFHKNQILTINRLSVKNLNYKPWPELWAQNIFLSL